MNSDQVKSSDIGFGAGLGAFLRLKVWSALFWFFVLLMLVWPASGSPLVLGRPVSLI